MIKKLITSRDTDKVSKDIIKSLVKLADQKIDDSSDSYDNLYDKIHRSVVVLDNYSKKPKMIDIDDIYDEGNIITSADISLRSKLSSTPYTMTIDIYDDKIFSNNSGLSSMDNYKIHRDKDQLSEYYLNNNVLVEDRENNQFMNKYNISMSKNAVTRVAYISEIAKLSIKILNECLLIIDLHYTNFYDDDPSGFNGVIGDDGYSIL